MKKRKRTPSGIVWFGGVVFGMGLCLILEWMDFRYQISREPKNYAVFPLASLFCLLVGLFVLFESLNSHRIKENSEKSKENKDIVQKGD